MSKREANTPGERIAQQHGVAPHGWVFPHGLTEVLAAEALVDIEPWYFLAERDTEVASWARIVAEQYPGRSLVPFAKCGWSDDVFCFDAHDSSGDPVVLQIHTFSSPGWEYCGQWPTFASWLAEAQRMHLSYDEEDEGTPEWVVPDVDPDQARREDAEEHRSGGLMAVWRRVRRALAGSHRDPA